MQKSRHSITQSLYAFLKKSINPINNCSCQKMWQTLISNDVFFFHKFKFNKKNCANSGDICGAFPYKSFPNWANYSDELLQYGMVNYLEVLTAKDNALNTEINYIDNKYKQMNAVIQLYKALGGGN